MDSSISLDRIIQRGKEVATFDTRTYQEIVRDPRATSEAAIVVAAVAVASGLGRLFAGPGPLIGSILAMLIGWVVAAGVIYFVGSRITAAPTTTSSVERVMRAVGYAAVPNVFMFLTGIWLVGGIIAFILSIWTLATLVLAIRASLDMTLGRSIATALIAWLPGILVIWILGVIFGINPQVPF